MLAPISCCLLQLGLLFIALLFGVLLFASFVAAGPQKYTPKWPTEPLKWCPEASESLPELTQNDPWSTLGTPRGPKILLVLEGIHFWGDFGPQNGAKMDPKIDQKFTFFVKKWVEQPLWPYVSSPPDVFSFVGQICLYFWKAQPLKTFVFPRKNNDFQKTAVFQKMAQEDPK